MFQIHSLSESRCFVCLLASNSLSKLGWAVSQSVSQSAAIFYLLLILLLLTVTCYLFLVVAKAKSKLLNLNPKPPEWGWRPGWWIVEKNSYNIIPIYTVYTYYAARARLGPRTQDPGTRFTDSPSKWRPCF